MVDMYSRVSAHRAQRGLTLPVVPQVGDSQSSPLLLHGSAVCIVDMFPPIFVLPVF